MAGVTVVATQTNTPNSAKAFLKIIPTLAVPKVNIALSNVAAGSAYLVVRSSDKLVLFSGIASGTTGTFVDINCGQVEFFGNFYVSVDVRRSTTSPKYKALKTSALVTGVGANIFIPQETDTIA